ncbi:SusC/RagA family TonB-linked outer membrane protein [Carboxylicivirga marina]|uniref:SusC/RagA family TonB-linked outer membrane protein n=1 Tax=Carboxylicivirga marina TaxID=2800988 RepID=UPI0025974E62|nr:SusC/RagA family TonB-linked outer membrane protein [uncultured Carboxylicivirga sp.]
MRRLALIASLILFVGLNAMFAQTTTITGLVTDSESGDPMPGVSVVVRGTTIGTVTNVDGNYSLSVPDDATNLLYSFVGMKTQDVLIEGRTTINVVLESEAIGLDEVIATAYGTNRAKRTTSYQTEKVESEALLVAQPTRAASALTGKVAGLQVNVQDNGVNPKSQILLRGMRSISGNNEALVVIDGSIASTGAFDALNPNDIESVNVLKGASAAALYGSRASNGALIVVTKKGTKAKKFTAGVNHSTTFETVAYMPEFQTEYGTGWDGEYNNIENTNWGPRFDGTLRQIGPTFADGSYQEVPYAPVKDNLKDFYNTGSTHQTTAYFSGGDETGTFYMSLGYQDSEGIVPDDEYNRYSARINATKKIGNLELSANTNFMTDETNVVGSSIGDQDRTFYWFLLNTPANIPLTSYKDWQNPESYGYADNYFNAFYQNPYWAIGTNRDIDKSNRLTGNMAASWDINKNINFTTRLGINSTWGNGKNWRARQEYDEVLQPYHSTVSSFVEDSEFQSTNITGDALLSGDYNFGEDFSLKAILGASTFSSKYRNSYLKAKNLSIPDFYDVSNGTGQLEGAVDEIEKRTYGFFGDFTLGYKNWAFLTLTGRQDYTSTLSKDDNSYFYPAVGLSVVLTDAIDVLKDNEFLSYAKVTLSNSTVYNDLDPYQINERYAQSNSFPFGSLNGFYKSTTAVDANIKKEKLNTTEIGLNLGFLRSRFNLDASYYTTKTTDLITSTTPSYASGASSYLTNIGQLTGNGFEISLGGTVLQIGDLGWDVNVNYYTHTTTVDEIVDGVSEIALDAYTGYGTYAIKGEAFPYLKTVGYERDSQGRVIVDPVSGNPLVGAIQNQGRTTPKHTVGLNTQLNFKGITLAATFDYRTDFVYFAQGLNSMEFTGRSMESVSSNRQDFVWPNSVVETSPGVYVENTDIPITGGKMDFWQNRYNEIKENYVRDATALKLRELALNYTLPKNLLRSTGVFQRVTVGIVARNVYTWLPEGQTRFSDPEFRNTRGSDDPNGVGIGGYLTSPPTRSLGFNLNVEF